MMVGEQALHHPHQHHHPHLQSLAQRGTDDVTILNCKLDASAGGGGNGGMIQNFSDYLSDLSYPVNQPGEFIVPDLEQSWYSYVQGPVQNSTYLMRAPPDKLVSSSEWGTHFGADNIPFIHSNSQNGTGNGNSGFLVSGSRDQQQQHQQFVNGSASGNQTPTHQISSPAADKAIIIHDQINCTEIKDSVLDNGKSLLDVSQIKVEDENGIDGSISKNGLRLPAFQQAFGSTEIGRFSQHEGFFETSISQPEAQPEPKVSIMPQNTIGKRTRNPRGSRKNKANRSTMETPEKSSGWPLEATLPVKKEPPWLEVNGGGTMPPAGINLGMTTQMGNLMGMSSTARNNNCYMYPPMEEQQGYGQQWSHHPMMPPLMMQDPNGYYQHQHHAQHHGHQYCHQPYYNNQPDMPLVSPGRGFHPDYGEPFYSPYPATQNWRNHPYYSQHHFPLPHHQNIPPPYINQQQQQHSQYNDISPYRHCSAGAAGYQNHNRAWTMNRDFKIHNYSSGIV